MTQNVPAGDSNRIRFNDVGAGNEEQRAEIAAAIASVVEKGDFINGSAVREFEQEFAAYCGCAEAVGCASGTAALHLALQAAGVQPGDEVITSAMTFIATAEAIGHCRAKVVFADISPDTLNLDPASVAAAISPRTRAIIFVHLHGNPAGIVEVAQLATARGLLLVEDCAQAHGALISAPEELSLPCSRRPDGRVHVGSFGAAAAYSFFPAKNLGAFGDAGAATTGSPALAARMRSLANHGREEKYLHQVEGYNYRLDTVQAAILRVKLERLEQQVELRNQLAAVYEENLRDLDIRMQETPAEARHARHLFVIHTEQRDALQQHLKKHEVETGVHYPIPLHRQPAYASLGYREGSLPSAEAAARTTLSLPMYAQLPRQHAERVCDVVSSFFA